MKYHWTPVEACGKTGAALLGSTALYLAFGIFCLVGLPVGEEMAVVTGLLAGFLVWVGAMVYAVLARTALRAWSVLLGLALILGGGAFLASVLS